MSAANFDAHRDPLWLSWQQLQTQTDAALSQGITHYFNCIRQTALNALSLEALASARLGQNDERVFNHLVLLMETYREVIVLFDSPIKNISPDLVQGLCDILCSRLKQFEDGALGQDNPVAKEKHIILENAIISTARYIENLEQSYLSEHCQPDSLNLCQELLAGNTESQWQQLLESIMEKTLQSLHTHYIQTLQTCLASIDDLHTRKTAAYYTDLLEREWEVLGIIIQVQVKAIEAAFEASEDEAIDGLYPILSKLREAYQQTGPLVGGLRKMMQQAGSPRPVPDITMEDFAKLLAAGITAPPPATIDSHALMAALLPKADELFESIRANHLEQIINLQQAVTCEISLGEEILSVFEKAGIKLVLIQKLQEHEQTDPPNVPTTDEPVNSDEIPVTPLEPIGSSQPQKSNEDNIENDILSGIIETLEIKVESLAESLQFFRENGTKLLSAISTGLPVLSEENLTNAANQLLSAWCGAPPTLETMNDFLESCASLDPFVTYNEQFGKHVSNSSAKVEKASIRFKKETLLYEISTYEEILYHSVSRLRKTLQSHISEAVGILDETFIKLESLLTESGITIISPAPHEPFNGREHEVLIAEETEGFAKGEIVKVMTSGYKFKDQVILRANVIAAR
ncbi:MAG: nucleotide exchange factor GrpE [Defluviitaleaceae bacterium]|nr:nucleotide exchange factor GrpE [Defluviitaleaceae bacterium]